MKNAVATSSTVYCYCLLLLILPVAIRSARYGGGNNGSPPAFTTNSGSYVSTYDHMDIGRLLRNEKLVSAYLKCFLNEGPCTAEGRQVKAFLLPDIIRTVCSRCSPKQKEMARQVLTHFYVNRRPEFERLMRIYDTEGKYNAIINFMNRKQ